MATKFFAHCPKNLKNDQIFLGTSKKKNIGCTIIINRTIKFCWAIPKIFFKQTKKIWLPIMGTKKIQLPNSITQYLKFSHQSCGDRICFQLPHIMGVAQV
jgi:mRNA deadenylase 3'-5' endonuclease subunit Ccr4